MEILKQLSAALIICLLFTGKCFSQCENTLPVAVADLTSSPTASTTVTIGGEGLDKCCDAQFGDPHCQVLQLNLHPSVQGLNFSFASSDDCFLIIYEAADCPLGFGSGICGQICTNQTSLEYLICNEGPFDERELTINATDCCLGLPFAPSSICEGDDLNLSSSAFDNTVQHAWYTEDPTINPGSLISNERNPVISGLAVGTHDFWLVLDDASCTTEPIQITVEVVPIPIVTASFSGGECGEDIQLTGGATPAGDYVFLWSGPNGFFSTEQNPIISNPSPENEGVYTLNVFNDAGCSSLAASLTLDDLSNFNVEMDIFITSLSACSGDDITFFTDFIQGDNIEYIWTHINLLGQTETFTTTGPSLLLPSITEDQNGVYSVFATDGTCETMSSPLFEIEVQKVPDQAMIIGETVLCEGQSLNLNTELIPDAIYSWSGPNGFSSDQPNIFIDDVSLAMAGTYTLEIVINNCFSDPTNVEVEISEGIPDELTLFNTALVTCEGDQMTLFTNFLNGTGVVYNWTHINLLGQTQMFTTTDPTFVVDAASADDSGVYTVFASIGSCESAPSPLLEIEVQETPAAPVINGETNFCAGETFALSTDEIMGATYEWSGPNNFSSTESNFEIENATESIAGTYTLVVNLNGCPSEVSTVEVEVIEGIDETLTISNSTLVNCEGETLLLFTNFIDGPNVVYNWTFINLVGQTVMFETTDPVLSFDEASVSQSGVYTVVASIGACSSEPAELLEVTVQAIPETPVIEGITELCPDDDLVLTTELIPDATYAWFGPNGFTSVDSAITIANVDSSIIGQYNLQIVVNGCASVVTNTTVNLNELPPSFSVSNDGPYCEGDDVNLFVINADLTLTYSWFDLNTGAFLGSGAALVLPGEMASDEQSFYIQVTNAAGCTYDPIAANDLNAQTTISFATTPLLTADAGQDGISCDGTFNLNATAVDPTGSIFGFWSNTNGDQIVEDPLEANTMVSNLAAGENIFVWQIDDGVCGIISSDSISIILQESAVAENDQYTTSSNTTLVLDPLENDNLVAGDFEISSISDFAGGTASINQDGTIELVPNPGFNGSLSFTYELCSVDCPDLCSQAVVRVDVEGTDECIIPTVITPNGDDFNDEFAIYCLDSFPGSSLKIFNRWGEVVFESEDYQNNWTGTYESEVLPAGTYFYVLDINNGMDDPKNGYIYIQRN